MQVNIQEQEHMQKKCICHSPTSRVSSLINMSSKKAKKPQSDDEDGIQEMETEPSATLPKMKSLSTFGFGGKKDAEKKHVNSNGTEENSKAANVVEKVQKVLSSCDLFLFLKKLFLSILDFFLLFFALDPLGQEFITVGGKVPACESIRAYFPQRHHIYE